MKVQNREGLRNFCLNIAPTFGLAYQNVRSEGKIMLSGLVFKQKLADRFAARPMRRVSQSRIENFGFTIKVCLVKFADESRLNFIHRLNLSHFVDRYKVLLEFDCHLKKKRYIIFLRLCTSLRTCIMRNPIAFTFRYT